MLTTEYRCFEVQHISRWRTWKHKSASLQIVMNNTGTLLRVVCGISPHKCSTDITVKSTHVSWWKPMLDRDAYGRKSWSGGKALGLYLVDAWFKSWHAPLVLAEAFRWISQVLQANKGTNSIRPRPLPYKFY
jgi:hypothetical protein